MSGPHAKPRVFVLLHEGLGLRRWSALRAQNGAMSETPYGYHFADDACALGYSADLGKGPLAMLLRRASLKVLGFNLPHAWRNRRSLFAADMVWTHTEHEHLAAALLLRLFRRQRPQLLAQSVWLADGWPRFPAWKRRLYRWLLARADVLTVLSGLNRQVLQSLFPTQPVEQVYFGIEIELLPPAPARPAAAITGRALRVLAIGNDRHRDWATLKQALANLDGVEVRLISQALPAHFTAGADNFDLRPPRVPQDIPDAYAWADLLVVPLKNNLHASGITVVLEGVAQGVPVLCSDAGGLSGYFSSEQISYVPVADPAALRAAVVECIDDYAACVERAHRATRRLNEAPFTAREFARQHVTITERMLAARVKGVTADGPPRVGGSAAIPGAVGHPR
jgi:glycosyltransferase involved in cell wall biosynthesis